MRAFLVFMIFSFTLLAFSAIAVTWPADYKFPTTAETTLKSKYIVLGKVIKVEPLDNSHSLVTVGVERDVLEEIRRSDSGETDRGDKDDKEMKTVAFFQEGGPTVDGYETELVGLPVLKMGDRRFMAITPAKHPVKVNGQVYDLIVDWWGGGGSRVHPNPEAPDDPLVQFWWGGLHLTVSQVARITRAILKAPERMESLEKHINAIKGTHRVVMGKLVMAPDAKMDLAFNEISAIERELKLPLLPKPGKGDRK